MTCAHHQFKRSAIDYAFGGKEKGRLKTFADRAARVLLHF
jgi:hypothetical protein